MDIASIIMQKIDLAEFIRTYAKADLTRVSNGWRCKCPIHGSDNQSSMYISDTGLYCCYSCNSAGNVINFLSDFEHISYTAALERLAAYLNINLKDDESYQKCKSVEQTMTSKKEYGIKNLHKVEEYLKQKRGFTDETINAFGLGGVDGGVCIPLHDANGRCVAMAKRQFDKKPKYINSYNNELYDKSAFLFNLDKAFKLINDRIYVVEGYMDAISGYQMGLPVVAYCGNELHRDQIKTLTRYLKKDVTIILVPDNDEEGMKRVPRVRDYFNAICPDRQVRVALVPDSCKDMNDMLLEGIDPSKLETLHIDRYVVDYLVGKCSTEEEKYHVVEEYLPTVRSGLIRLDIIKEMAKKWDKDYETLKEYFDTVGKDSDDILAEASDVTGCINDLKSIYRTGGFPTHFQQIDNCIRRVEKKQVIVVGATAGTGKTDFAIEFMLRAICQNNMRAIFFSLEMPKGKLIERVVAKLIGCSIGEVEGYVASDDMMVNKAIAKLQERMLVFDGNHLSIDDINERIKLVNSKNVLGGPVDIVFVDYFGYMQGTSTFEDASTAAKKMKGMAKDNNIIFVMLSQLNRGASTYDEPTMSQLKSTGDLEASADYVFLLWRPARDPNLDIGEKEELANITRLKIDKARDGMYGPNLAEFRYDKETSRLEENYA
nr:MAG TPA: Helicase, ATPase, REPLICATION [Caudoviricetes sp.]